MTTAKRDHPPPSPSSHPSGPKKARSYPTSPFVHSVPPLAGPSTSTATSHGSPSISAEGDDDGFTKVMSRDERRKMKKVDKHKPSFQFDLAQFRNGKKIGIAHIRDLVLYLLGDAQKPQWIVTENKTNISHVVLLLIPGLLPEHLGLEIPLSANLPFPTNPTAPVYEGGITSISPGTSQVPLLNEIFLRGVPTRAPGDNRKMHSVIQALLNSPIPDSRRKELEKDKIKEREERAANRSESLNNPPPFELLLTPNQMIDNGYNLPSYIQAGDRIIIPGRPTPVNGTGNGAVAGPSKLPSEDRVDPRPLKDGWVETPEAQGPPADGRWPVLSMDCEMVLTEDGQQLTRVSIIDYHTGLLVLDELVKPRSPVTDYRTQWSGMTAERLLHATHTLETIQEAVLTGPAAVVTPHTILLGHSLECDLNALQIRHPLCLDTALMFKHPRGAPYKPALKWLSQKYMQKEIQGGKAGHDSEEDARACVGLLKLKEEHGPEFGTFDEYTETLFDRLSRHSAQTGPQTSGTGRTSAVCDYSNTRNGAGSRATTPIKCESDDEVVENMIAEVPKHDLVYGRMMELANHLGFNNTSDALQSTLSLSKHLSALNARLARLHASLPKNTALILMNGHSDPRPMLELAARRARWERTMKERAGHGEWSEEAVEDRWMAEDDRELERKVAEAREGMAFFCVK